MDRRFRIWGGCIIGIIVMMLSCDSFSSPYIYLGTNAWSSTSDQLVFEVDEDGEDSELYHIDSDGKNLLQLTDNDYSDSSPAWSPDEKAIAYISYSTGQAEIYLMDVNGENVRRVTESSMNKSEPFWSPDGHQIAFLSCSNYNSCEIYVIDSSGESLVQLTAEYLLTGGAYNHDFAWSPDSTRIAFSALDAGIFVVDVHQGIINKLTDGNAIDENPVWLTDNQIAFISNRENPIYYKYRNIYAVDTDGSNFRQLTHNPGIVSIAVSPDSRLIVFNQYSNITANHYVPQPVYMMNTDGTDLRQLDETSTSFPNFTWSPNAEKLAFIDEYTLYVVDVITGKVGVPYTTLEPIITGDIIVHLIVFFCILPLTVIGVISMLIAFIWEQLRKRLRHTRHS